MTPEIAEAIYASLLETPNLTGAFLKLQEDILETNAELCQSYSMDKFVAVDAEVKRILSLRGKQELVSPAIMNDKGEITTPAEYVDIEITSEILDVETVLADNPIVGEE